MKEYEFDHESEEDLNQEIDALVEYINESVNTNAEIVRLLSPMRVNNVRLCAAVLNKFAGGEDLRIECEMHKPLESSAYISLEGKTISMDDTRWLTRVGSLASNMEVYPLNSGGVRLTFMFYGITKEIE